MIFRFEHELWKGVPGDPAGTVFAGDEPGAPLICVRIMVGETADDLRATGWILLTADEWNVFRIGVEDFEVMP